MISSTFMRASLLDSAESHGWRARSLRKCPIRNFTDARLIRFAIMVTENKTGRSKAMASDTQLLVDEPPAKTHREAQQLMKALVYGGPGAKSLQRMPRPSMPSAQTSIPSPQTRTQR